MKLVMILCAFLSYSLTASAGSEGGHQEAYKAAEMEASQLLIDNGYNPAAFDFITTGSSDSPKVSMESEEYSCSIVAEDYIPGLSRFLQADVSYNTIKCVQK